MHFIVELFFSVIGGCDGLPGFCRGNAESLLHIAGELTVSVLTPVPVEKRCVKGDMPTLLRVIGVADDNRIAFDNGTHRFAGALCIFRGYCCDGWHENTIHTFFRQIAEVSVHQFSREADGIGSDRRQSLFVNFACAQIGQLNLKSQSTPEGGPEWHGFPIGKHPGQTDGDVTFFSSFRIRVVFKQQFLSKFEEIWCLFTGFLCICKLLSDRSILRITEDFAAFAPVVGYPGIAVGKTDNGSFTMVGTERARGVGFLCIGKISHTVNTDKCFGWVILFKAFLSNESSADGTHNAGIRGTDDFTTGVLLKGTKYGIISECTALDNNLVTQTVQIGDSDNLCKNIFNDGTAQAGHNICGLFAVSLLCDNAAVHENRTAAAKGSGVVG